MDDVRIEKLSEKLHNARMDGRIGTAKNLLSKMKIGILNADSPCMGKLVDDIHKSLEFVVQEFADAAKRSPEMYELLGLLLSLLKSAAVDPTKNTDTASMILEQLYQLKNMENLNGVLQKSLEETIDTICGLNQTTSTRYAAQVHQEQRALELALTSTISESAARDAFAKSHTSMFHGAGAILNLPLAYKGWKFPHFVLTERDERWLFDVDVRVKLQHECAARDMWAVLADLPAPAILLKTNLLHSVIDLVGAPFSRTDVEADPQGLHPLTALRWLESLLDKCRHAFRVQLDGTLCSRTPHHEEFSCGNNSHSGGDGADRDAPDLAGKLAQAMYALRHPLLPAPPPNTDDADSINVYQEALHNRQQTPMGTLSALFPTPSYPGLAFSCCAASLPLLQTRDTTVARAVLSLLRAALPYVLEPRLLGGNSGRLLDVEKGRLQHLLNRVEQLLAFFGDAFQLDAYLTLMYSEDPSSDDDEESDNASPVSSAHAQQTAAAQRAQARKEQSDATLDSLQTSAFDLTFLTAVVEVLRAVPVWALLPVGSASGDSSLSVGTLTQACICRLVSSDATIEALLPGCTEVAHSCLQVLDSAMLGRIQAISRILQSAKVFTSRTLPDEGISQLLPRLVSQLEDCVCLLDAGCPVSLPATQSAITISLPVLLQAAEQHAQECEYDQATPLLALIYRVLSCGDDAYKTTLLEHLLLWCTKSTVALRSLGTHGASMFAEAQVKLIRAFELDPATGRQTVSLLATPQMLQCLLSTYLTSAAPDSALAGVAVDLLEVLCEHLMNRGIANHIRSELSSGGGSEWVALLLPMKALEWEMEPVDGAQCSFIAFARELQDACADSASPTVRAAFARSLVAGLFHSASAVRINSALRVRRDLLGVSPFAGPENAELRLGVQAYDPFPANGSGGLAMRLGDWTTDAAVSADGSSMIKASKNHTAKQPATSAFTHADLRKIASIGLGELDASTRATALERVSIMLDSDAQLLHTVDADWCASTLRSALQQLSVLAPISPNAVTCDGERMQAMTDAECRLFTETARLVGFLFTHFAFLRQAVCYHHTADSSFAQTVSILLKLLLSAHQLKKTNTSAYDAVQRVAAISAQVLCLLTCSAESWPLTELDAVKQQYVSAEGAEVRSTSLCVPTHVLRRFHYPASVSASNEYSKLAAGTGSGGGSKSAVMVGGPGSRERSRLGHIVQVLLHCAPSKPTQYPADDIVNLLVAETVTQSADRIHVATATKLFGLINEARNHTHMRETLSCALCLFQANPALLHVFVCLRMSLVTALSSIVTVNPRTHKDHITLCTTLDFLHHTFRSLHRSSTGAARYHMSESLYSDIIDTCNEAYSAVLPSMAAYFAEHFAQANTFFVSLTSGGRETDKEHAAAAHAVCTAYFRLLHTFSTFSDQRLQLGVMLSGHYVTTLLVHIAGSEMHSAYDRSVALSILENLLRNHVGGWEALCCVENPETAILGGNYQKPTKIAQLKGRTTKRPAASATDTSAAADFDVVDCLVRVVKLVRTPDSLQGTASVVGALRLLYLSLLQRQQSATLSWTLTESEAQWKWLVRLMYDRRAEVKVLAVEILGLVLKQVTAAEFGTTVTSVDSLAQTAPAVHSAPLSDDAAVPEVPSVETDLLHWPPFELLGHLVTDSTESTALRTCAIDILVHCYTEQPALQALMKATFKLATVMGALFECLAVKDSDHATTASIRSALTALIKLLSTRHDCLLQDVLHLARTMKLVPQVVELLNIRVQGSLNVRALARVSVYDDEYISRERTYFHSDALSLRAAAASTFELQGAGWQDLQSKVHAAEADGMRNSRAAACWLFFHLRSADPALFEECVEHSNLVYHLISCFSSVAEPISASSVYGFEFECASISAQAELLSLLISQEAAARPADSAGLLDPAPIGALFAYVQANEMVPSNVLKKMVLILLNIMDFAVSPKDNAASRTLQQLHCISSCLRLLCLMLNESHWRDLLGLGGPQENTSMSNPCAYMFDMLLSLRKLLTNLAASSTSAGQSVTLVAALLSRLDVTMVLFMQYSYEARVLFVQHSVQHQLTAAEAQRPSAQDKSIFRQHIDTVAAAVEFLNTPAPQTQPASQQQAARVSALSSGASSASVASAATPTFSASGPLTPEAKRSLQSLKAKTVTPSTKTASAGSALTPGSVAASPSAAAGVSGGAGRPPVNQSMSSWATKTSQSSKWRDKSRSYAWNKDRSDSARQNNSGAAPEMPDSLKLQLWSALTVLAAALPNCDSAMDWAIDLKLHQSLSRLLRFTAKYSVATLVSSNTHISSAAASTAAMSDDLWVPSNGMLASAISALCCSFTYHHTHAKQCFASTGDAAAAVLGGNRAGKSAGTAVAQGHQGAGQGGTALHQLISVGISRSFVPVTRWLCLSMAGSLLSGARSLGTPTLKSTFSQIIALSLQRSLHSAHSDADAVVPLLNTLASFLGSEEDLTHLTQLCKKDQSAMLRNFQLAQGLVKEHASVEDFKLITFPELMQWVWSSAGSRNDVAAALCRCLGRISLVDKSHRTVGNLLSDSMLSVLCECYNTYTHPCVSAVSALSLWHIVHNSEKAKVMVRELMLQSPNSVTAADYSYGKVTTSGAGVSKAARVLFGSQQDDHQQLSCIHEDEGSSGGDSQEEPVARAKCFIDSLRVV